MLLDGRAGADPDESDSRPLASSAGAPAWRSGLARPCVVTAGAGLDENERRPDVFTAPASHEG
jgi:hypothetical protein